MFIDVNERLYFSVVQILARFGVPFFAVSTGYLTTKAVERLRQDPADLRKSFLKRWWKLILLYLIWSIIYLVYSIPKWINIGWFSAWAFVDYGVGAVRTGSHYHFWYLLSLIYAWPLFYLCIKYLNRKLWTVVSPFLFMVKVLSYSYYRLLPARFEIIHTAYTFFTGLSDAIFLILPLLLIGAFIAGEKKRKRIVFDLIGLAVCVVMLVIEASNLWSKGLERVSYVVFTYPTTYFFFRVAVENNIKIKGSFITRLGIASLTVYCIHPMIAELCEGVIDSTVIRFAIAAVSSTAVGLLWGVVSERIRNMKKRPE